MSKAEEYIINRDGDKWCASGPGFENIQVSPVGFGDTPDEALKQLISEMATEEGKRREYVRYWECSPCSYVFGRRMKGDFPPCPRCQLAQGVKEVFDIERRFHERRFSDDDIQRRPYKKKEEKRDDEGNDNGS